MKQIQEINSRRIYSKVFGNRISIELPKNSDVQEVEVIIMPTKVKHVGNITDRDDWKKDFIINF